MKTGHTPSRSEPEYWEDCEIPWFTLADVWQLREGRVYLGETAEKISRLGLANSAAELLPAGTVVLSRTASVGFSGIMPAPMATSQDFWNWVPRSQILPEYLLYLFRAMTQVFQRLTMGSTHKTIYQPDAARLCICVPPPDEQRAIADFLDAQTAKIDALVAKKRALIEKLAEKRRALISRVVTSGIGDARNSLHGWRTVPLMRLTDPKRPIMYGIVLPGPNVDDGVPIVKGGDVKPGRLALDSLCKTTFEIEAGYARSRLKTDDMVFSIRGSIGEVELVPAEIEGANLTQDAARVAPAASVQPRWLLHALKAESVVGPLLALSIGAAVRGVNIRDLKRVPIPTPPVEEQRAIADFLDRETAKIDALVAKVEAAIERLQEYRAALITAAVTGKIDVRGFAPAAPPA
ncbi:MAG: hypothetical protein DCC71_01740 [Proteobacteria bacterium]|nr:MAG: hypothetical protein DCC71_01740 [Pseudomonadota bacterium]